ncbi:unnamed protein product [Adineta steineri]|uniref:Uncharacterized protein n=1 Tax=Adineta steineri TaxID=433720 RepID=A0A819PGV7_9BILA|nr:unnamed protein product [Adineta steineri]CAF1352102.1 unnamed protein product [Adineta steineri]CAF3630618.1 unnamed protein product [Adineta steineri]CAF4014128.1 unnamed protein product [Adineta steineri]
MSSTSSQTSSLHRSNELVDLTSSSTTQTNSTNFAPIHRTVELENLYDHINNDTDNDKQILTSPTTTKKVLTKCMTVIGDGSDKQI